MTATIEAPFRGDESSVVTVVVDGPPVPKGRPRNYRGRMVTPAKTRNYEAAISIAGAKAARESGRFGNSAALEVYVTAHVPIPASWSAKRKADAIGQVLRPIGRPDADNFLKAALDGLNGVLFGDDAQCVITHAEKKYSDRPRLEIEIRRIA